MKTEILTPVGRLVSGDCFDPQTKDAENNPLIIKTGPNAGKPRVNYYLGLAIAKSEPGYQALSEVIMNEARTGFPQLFDAQGNCTNPAFSFKITDGDSTIPNSKGKKPCDNVGYPGHWVLHFSGSYAPKCCRMNNGVAEDIIDPLMLKRGYYIRIYGSVASNGSTQQPGIYLNHSRVELVGYGQEIASGVSAAVAFAGPAAVLPAGASATPVAPESTIATPAAPGTAPAAPPHTEILTPPADFNVVVQGNVVSALALKAANWTDAQIAALPKA